jgi:hypothetical protein
MADTVVDADTFDPGFISEPVKNGKKGKRLYAIMMSKGRDPQDVSDYIKATYNYSHSSEIERKDYDAICTWVEGKEDD